MKVFCFARRLTLAAMVISCLCSMSFADFNAGSFVSNFNSLNNGQGYRFTHGYSNGEVNLAQVSGTAAIDTSGYDSSVSTGGTNYFHSFCIEPSQGTANSYKGLLNYNSATGISQNSLGYAVKLGTAVLYSQFASGTLDNYAYSTASRATDAGLLRTALQATMGVTTVSNWSSNKFLAQLLSINSSQSYWSGAYDPNQYYHEVGNYAVFALNVYTSNNVDRQDFLYAVSTTNGDAVPEPATLLLWSIGGISLAGASWRKRRNAKK